MRLGKNLGVTLFPYSYVSFSYFETIFVSFLGSFLVAGRAVFLKTDLDIDLFEILSPKRSVVAMKLFLFLTLISLAVTSNRNLARPLLAFYYY